MAALSGEQLITDAMRSVVGAELDRSVSFPIAASDIRRWALAVYHPHEPPREFWDQAWSAQSRFGGIVAPEEFNPFAWMTAEPAGMKPSYEPGGPSIETRLGVADVATANMLNGGTEISYGARQRPGDVITAHTVLSDYHQREGRLGSMLFTTSTSSWVNQNGAMVKTVANVLIRY